MGAVALQKWGKEHPEQVRQNAVRALGVARQVTTARAQKARELQEEQKARAHLPRGFPSRSSRDKQLEWLRNEYLKMGTESMAPAAWRWRALKGALLCVLQLPADSEEPQLDAERARIAFLERELKHSDALRQEAVQRAQKAEQRVRELEAEPVAVTPVAIEQSPKAPATGPVAGAASPLEFYIRADAEGAVYLGRDYDSCCRAPARRVTQSPQPMAIL